MRTITADGYAIVPDVLPPEHVDQLLDDLGSANARRSRAGARHTLRHAAVRTLAEDPRLTDLARTVLGHDAFPFRATLFDKSQKANWLVVWHQDTALPLRERHDHPAWGPWSVKDGVIYAHAPATALNRVLALRVTSMIRSLQMDRCAFCPARICEVSSATTKFANAPSEFHRSSVLSEKVGSWQCGPSSSTRLRSRAPMCRGASCTSNTRNRKRLLTDSRSLSPE